MDLPLRAHDGNEIHRRRENRTKTHCNRQVGQLANFCCSNANDHSQAKQFQKEVHHFQNAGIRNAPGILCREQQKGPVSPHQQFRHLAQRNLPHLVDSLIVIQLGVVQHQAAFQGAEV